ncbi:hypothetical protein ACFV3R_29150 [Streptomyces sp. NPDC059740]|uniref:hypothetical protein n=1 Tax=Streptomyces sp. NPDC059740 TaxID=3346926 RepID=UPI003646C4F8
MRAALPRRVLVPLVLWWAALVGFYLVCVGPVSWWEVLVGGCAAGLAAAGGRVLREAVRLHHGGRGAAHWLSVLLHWPTTLLREQWLLLRVLLAVVRRGRGGDLGRIDRVCVPPGTDVAWASLVLSATAGTCVLGAEAGGPREPGVLLVHRLADRPSALEELMTSPGDRSAEGDR